MMARTKKDVPAHEPVEMRVESRVRRRDKTFNFEGGQWRFTCPVCGAQHFRNLTVAFDYTYLCDGRPRYVKRGGGRRGA